MFLIGGRRDPEGVRRSHRPIVEACDRPGVAITCVEMGGSGGGLRLPARSGAHRVGLGTLPVLTRGLHCVGSGGRHADGASHRHSQDPYDDRSSDDHVAEVTR